MFHKVLFNTSITAERPFMHYAYTGNHCTLRGYRVCNCPIKSILFNRRCPGQFFLLCSTHNAPFLSFGYPLTCVGERQIFEVHYWGYCFHGRYQSLMEW